MSVGRGEGVSNTQHFRTTIAVTSLFARYNILNDNDIEGEEEGCVKMDGEIKLTPFNMKEEQEEGHFDADGHFQWDKSKNDVRDNWLDNLEWVKPKALDAKAAAALAEANSSDSDDDDGSDPKRIGAHAKQFDAIAAYRRMLELMQPGETVKRALQRLGGRSARLSSAERWRQKKAGIVDPNGVLVVELTELSNTILTKLGNMDVYEERYEQIRDKYAAKTTVPTASTSSSTASAAADELDMYADDFDTKEKTVLTGSSSSTSAAVPANEAADASGLMKPPQSTVRAVRFVGPSKPAAEEEATNSDVLWEFKWKQSDDEVHTGFSSAQMQLWVEEGYFKDGVFVRKCEPNTVASFNSSNRIDFELYM